MSRFVSKFNQLIYFNFIIRILIESYYEFAINAFLNFAQVRPSSDSLEQRLERKR